VTTTGVRRALRLAAPALLVLGAAIAADLGLPLVAFARGGGGGHSGGGSHSGGGGGISGGGGGGFGGSSSGGVSGGGGAVGFSPLLFLGIAGIVLLIVLYALMRSRANRTSTMETLDSFQTTTPTAPPSPALAGVQELRAADPEFEPESFMQKAEMAYLLVKHAFQDRNLHAARAFLSPQLWQQWSQEVNQLIANHRRPVLENLNVRGLQVLDIAHPERGGAPAGGLRPAGEEGGPPPSWEGDMIQVHFDVVAATHFDDDQTGKRLSGTTEDQRFAEVWEFWRAPGAKTVASGGATASKCPNCGGLLKLNDDGKCDWCGADIASGKYDWVVTGWQGAAFRGVRTADTLGLDQLDPATGIGTLTAEDPAFDVNAFMQRVQQAFFTLQKAWQDRDLEASRAFMSPGLYLGWSSQVQQLVQLRKKNILEGLRIDDLRLDSIVHGRVFDDVTVRVTATCADYEVDEQTGQMTFGSREPSFFTEFWTFQRSRGAKTTGRSALDKVCPNCGAPLEINQIGECRYCNAAVTSGRFDWVLSRIEQDDG
jgi:predicted lipid-binding transport protein (Tim44 family)